MHDDADAVAGAHEEGELRPGTAKRRTIAAYDADAAAYAGGTALTDAVRAHLDRFADALPAGSRVLEVGAGGGRDAVALGERGLSVRATDVTPAFVALLRGRGLDADLLDPLVDDLDDPARPGTPYDGVWASACLLHVDRGDLPTVLARLAAATRPGGRLHVSLKEGDGEAWSTHGHVSGPRRFVYWRREPLLATIDEAGWVVDHVEQRTNDRGEPWIAVGAARR